MLSELQGPLKTLTDEKTSLIQSWVDAGKIAPVAPYHLLFSIWATTQHYADFDVQVHAVLGDCKEDCFETAQAHLDHMFRATLRPET